MLQPIYDHLGVNALFKGSQWLLGNAEGKLGAGYVVNVKPDIKIVPRDGCKSNDFTKFPSRWQVAELIRSRSPG